MNPKGQIKNEKMKKQKNATGILFVLGIVAIIFYGALVVWDVYQRENNLTVFLSENNNVKKGDEIIVDFSTKISGRFDLNQIIIEPPLDFQARFLNNRQLSLKVTGAPSPDTKYNIIFKKIPTFWLDLNKNLTTGIYSVQTPNLKAISPSDSTSEVAYDTKIKIDLDEPLAENMFLEVLLSPSVKMNVVEGAGRKTFVLVPEKKLLKSQKYEMTVTVRYQDDESFGKTIYQGFFVTKIPPQVVYNFNKDGVPAKTEDITWEIAPKIAEGKYIDIDLTHQVMSIFKDGLRKGSYKISSGKRGMNTPTGSFRVFSKVPRPWSAKYGLYMPYYLGFTYQGHGIHELPEWPSGYKEGANHLGIPVSHGCVRLGVGPAKLVYDFAEKGTPVVVHY